MFRELKELVRNVGLTRPVYNSDEVYGSVVIAVACNALFLVYPDILPKIEARLWDILVLSGILSGTLMLMTIGFMLMARQSDVDEKTRLFVRVSVGWFTWSIVCSLFLVGYVCVLFLLQPPVVSLIAQNYLFSLLAFLIAYVLMSAMCSAMLIRWIFHNKFFT